MSANRIAPFLADDLAYARAKRQQRTLTAVLESIEEIADDDHGHTIEFLLPSVEEIVRGDATVAWLLDNADQRHDVPVSDLQTLRDVDQLRETVAAGMREFAGRLLAAADRLDGESGVR
jgi:hypothetical protein